MGFSRQVLRPQYASKNRRPQNAACFSKTRAESVKFSRFQGESAFGARSAILGLSPQERPDTFGVLRGGSGVLMRNLREKSSI